MADLSLRERIRQRIYSAGTTSSRSEIESLCHETSREVLQAFAGNPHLQERDLLRILDRKDLAQEVVLELAQNSAARKSYPIQLAIVKHPKTPRQVVLRLMKFLYVFDLLSVAQTAGVPADVKKIAEEGILQKIKTMPEGEKKTLARRGTGRVAASLLMSSSRELIRAALDNPFVGEVEILKALSSEDVPHAVIELVSLHPKWANRYQLRLALIRNPQTPLARTLAFLPHITITDLRDACLDHRMSEQVRHYIEAHCRTRANNPRQRALEL